MKQILIGMSRLLLHGLLGRRPTGIDRVIISYLHYYKKNVRGVFQLKLVHWRFNFVLSHHTTRQIMQLIDSKSKLYRFRIALLLIKSILRQQKKQNLAGSFLLNIEPTRFDGYPQISKQEGVMNLFMVHDLIPLKYPEYCPPKRPKKFLAMVDHVVTYAHGILTNSRSTLEELHVFTSSQYKLLPPAEVVLLGSNTLLHSSTVMKKQPLSQPYFVILGTIEPRKNHLLLLQVWRRLAERMKEKTPRLVIIGKRGWELENIVDFLERCDILRELVIECFVDDSEVVNYLTHAQALLFPTFAEGYGLPLAEALSLKVPVIASDLPVFKEIAADIPEYIDPLDGLSWLAMIEAYTDNNSVQRVSQLKRLSHYSLPTWTDHFTKVDAFMDSLRRREPLT
ncbi:TPA: glycosyltransferase family 4 protein [Legionella anisa]